MTATRPITHLAYLHGFRSSPRSFKAQRMQAVVDQLNAGGARLTYWCPQLPPSPRAAIELVERELRTWPAESRAVIGSSLGGFYATVMAERLDCPAIVINPVVEPARDLARYIGEQTSYHDPDDRFFFRPEFVDELKALEVHPTRPERYFALIATGDEVLDWREMQARYAACPTQVVQGSDHSLHDFERYLPEVLRRLGWG